MDNGKRVQFSVFLCDLTRERVELEEVVVAIMNLTHDSAVQIAAAPVAIRALGCPRRLPASGPQTV